MGKRIISFILCVCMLLSVLHDFVIVSGSEEAPQVTVLKDGAEIEELILAQDEKVTLDMNVDIAGDYDYHWQILAVPSESLWVDIQDMTGTSAEISYALVYSVLDDSNSAKIRAAVAEDGQRYFSSPVKVFVTGNDNANFGANTQNEIITLEDIPMAMNAPAKRLATTGGDVSEYVHITVNYLSATDMDHSVFQPYTAKIEENASFNQRIISPSQIGFKPVYFNKSLLDGDDLYDGASFSITMGDETRTYTYNGTQKCFKYVDGTDTLVESDPDWLAQIFVGDADTVSISYDPLMDAHEDITVDVYYIAVDVPYQVKYFFQNINDDGYTQNAAISYSGKAKTGTIVSDDELYAPVLDYYGVSESDDYGFSPLYHYPEAVAADGSTIFNCYYDRNYYFIKFDMDGGYGVEPIYARYGASFVIAPPTKAGYLFLGWDEITSYKFKVYTDRTKSTYLTDITLNETDYVTKGSPSAYTEPFELGGTTFPSAYFEFENASGDGHPDVGTDYPNNFIGNVTSKSVSYKAIWQTVDTTYTIVYWAENADNNEYSFWGNKSVPAKSASVLSDFDAIVSANPASGVPLTDSAYFTYNSKKTNFVNNAGVIVEGDGSTVINVYYSRNMYDILFYDTGTRCSVEEHVHTDACYEYDCTTDHVHDASCYRCGLTENPHTELCCSKDEHVHGPECLHECTLDEHTHTAACYKTECLHVHDASCCDIEYHDHTSGCTYQEQVTCTLEEHTHGIACYTNQTGYQLGSSATNNQGRAVMTAISNPQAGYVYRYRRNNTNTNYIWFYDGLTWYYLGTGNYRGITGYGTLATPTGNGSYTMSTSAATMSICNNKPEHTHTSSCYKCTGYEHTHSATCYSNRATTTLATGTNYSNGRPTTNLTDGTLYVRYANRTYYCSIYYGGNWYQYTRNGEDTGTYQLSMTCNKVEHTHTTACCTKSVHTHTSGCNTAACTHECSLANGCITIICGQTEHTHSEACRYKCNMVAHAHDASCCTKTAHTHSTACVTVGGSYRDYGNGYYFKLSATALTSLSNATRVSVNGVNLYYNSKEGTNQQYLYYKIGDKYYQLLYGTNTSITYSNYSGNTGRYSTLTITSNCSLEEHTHNDGTCICDMPEHVHTDSCYYCETPEHTHGDGTCNTAACDDPTHHTHTADCLGCEFKTEHVHSASCPRNLICTKPEHSHSDGTCSNSGKYLVYKITAKYNADIHAHWPIKGGNGTQYTSANGYRWSPGTNGLGLDSVLVYMDRMPGMERESGKSLKLTADKATGRNNITMHYCVQTIPNDSTAEYVNYLGEAAEIRAGNGQSSGYQFVIDYRRAGAYYAGITMDVDFIDLEGFEKYRLYTNSNVDIAYANNTTTRNGTDDYFYYLRKQYNLSFYNYNADWGTSYNVYYEQNMNPYNPGVPSYPSSLEPNAYEFTGWYTTPECYAGTEFDWTAENKMPAADVKLYAKWTPVTHVVRFFETYDIMLEYEDTHDESLVYKKASMPDAEYKHFVEHGNFVGSIPNPDKLLVTNPGGTVSEYDFNGWFIIQNENKKAFTPLDMPITRDTNVFADWGTHTAQPYAVHYALDVYETDSEWLTLLPAVSASRENKETFVYQNNVSRTYICLNDGTDESPVYRWHRVISDATKGYAYQGTTRTFAARAGDTYHQLYTAYDVDFNEGYYPTPASHSITMVYEENSLEPIYNVFTFRYVYVEEVEYDVRYVDATTKEELHTPKHVTTKNAVVTERFAPLENYVPDAFYKNCILAVVEDPDNPGQYISSPENVITFYYTRNENAARYSVHFLLQKADEDSRTLTSSDYNITFDEDGNYHFSSKFEESGSRIDAVTDKDTQTPITPLDFPGFDLVSDKARYSNGGNEMVGVALANGCYTISPQSSGTDLFIFYSREQYPYKVYYLLYGADTSESALATYTTTDADTNDPKVVLADTDGIDPVLYSLYQTDFTATAKTIPGYTCISQNTISRETSPEASKNYIIFYYTHVQYTVQYTVVGGGGELSQTSQTVEYATDLTGSTATALPGYEFVGWFSDAACTIPATYDATTNPNGKGTTYTDDTRTTQASGAAGAYVFPEISKMRPNGEAGSDGNIFYAKFTPLGGELTITRDNSTNEGNGTQIFVYKIENNDTHDVLYVSIAGDDSVTIQGMPFGSYTITQDNGWSSRFEDAAETITLDTATGTEVVFDDNAAVQKWLNGNSDAAINCQMTTYKEKAEG